MSRSVECPKCHQDITDTYEKADPDVGIPYTSWFCEACNVTVSGVDEYERDYEWPLCHP